MQRQREAPAAAVALDAPRHVAVVPGVPRAPGVRRHPRDGACTTMGQLGRRTLEAQQRGRAPAPGHRSGPQARPVEIEDPPLDRVVRLDHGEVAQVEVEMLDPGVVHPAHGVQRRDEHPCRRRLVAGQPSRQVAGPGDLVHRQPAAPQPGWPLDQQQRARARRPHAATQRLERQSQVGQQTAAADEAIAPETRDESAAAHRLQPQRVTRGRGQHGGRAAARRPGLTPEQRTPALGTVEPQPGQLVDHPGLGDQRR